MEIIDNIKNEQDIRESLIELKFSVDEDLDIQEDLELKDKLIVLLSHEDPKVRKNSAILLGEYDGVGQELLDAYENEEIDYVKEAYLKGIAKQDDIESVAKELSKIHMQLINSDSSLKHIQAQLRVLNPLILQYKPRKKKIVKLQHEPVDVVLTTLPFYQYVVFEHVLKHRYKPVNQGVLVRTNSLYDLQNIRVYKDMLIPVKGASGLGIDANEISGALEKSQLIYLLETLYDDSNVFYFRVVDNMREKNPELIRKVSENIFKAFPHRLLNVQKDYDIEIVLKEVCRGKINIYLKLTHFKNSRFEYRKETISNSLNPYVAATLVQLAEPYLTKNGKVLDPFVGTGTLLIEKSIVNPSHFAAGIDIYAEAIEKARKNTKLAHQTIYYINKDALRYSNAELFDDIITDMPTFAQMNNERELDLLYERFFKRIPKLVRPGGYVCIYTSEIALVRKNLRLQEGYLSLEEHYDIPRGKNMFYYFIIQVR